MVLKVGSSVAWQWCAQAHTEVRLCWCLLLYVPVRDIFQLFIFILSEYPYKLHLCTHLASVYIQI